MKQRLLPFSISAVCLALAACGGSETNVIHENPIVKVGDNNAIGCTVASSNSCFEFLMEYPVAGLQYSCSSDNVNTFGIRQSGNSFTGGCNTKDKVTFFLNANENFRIEFGQVNLPDLGFISIKSAPVHLTILDMAAGLTGKKAQSFDPSDETVAVALKLIKILQAIGNQKTNSNEIGDVQPIVMTQKNLTNLDKITAKVDLQALQSNRYIDILKPWIDVSKISDVVAFNVLKQLTNVTFGAIYQADPPVTIAVKDGLLGYAGTGNSKKTLVGTFFLLSDRQGYTHGYGVQWRGIPDETTGSVGAAVRLWTKENPIIMRAGAQKDWIDPISKRIGTREKFKFVTANNENLFINQGRLLNDYGVAGSEKFYKYLADTDKAVKDDLSQWTQTVGSDQYEGHVDFEKAYPMTYLDRKVFKSEQTVEKGDKIIFPLYATLTFSHNTAGLKGIDLGIVIDEFGDIRTDIRANATETDMSGACGVVSDPTALELVDGYNQKQYRIGTISAANYQPLQQDLAIAPRIILSGAQYGILDGTVLGISTGLIGDTGTTGSSSGVKINLHNLITSTDNSLGAINISDYSNLTARWVNPYNVYKSLFVNAMGDKYQPTDLEKEQVKATVGTVGIKLASCYKVQTKA